MTGKQQDEKTVLEALAGLMDDDYKDLVKQAQVLGNEIGKVDLELKRFQLDVSKHGARSGNGDDAVRQYLKGVQAGANAKIAAAAQGYAQAGFDLGKLETARSFFRLLLKELPQDQAISILRKGLKGSDPTLSTAMQALVVDFRAAAKQSVRNQAKP